MSVRSCMYAPLFVLSWLCIAVAAVAHASGSDHFATVDGHGRSLHHHARSSLPRKKPRGVHSGASLLRREHHEDSTRPSKKVRHRSRAKVVGHPLRRDSEQATLPSDGGRVALLLIEAQNAYRGDFGQEMIDSMKALTDAFEERGLPVYRRAWYSGGFNTSVGRFLGISAARMESVHKAHGPYRMLSELAPNSKLARRRTWISYHYDMFSGLSLDKDLRNAGVTTVILAGGYLEMCVEATAYRAHDLGYDVIVAQDSVGPFGEHAHAGDASLLSLTRSGTVKIMQSSAIIDRYAGSNVDSTRWNNGGHTNSALHWSAGTMPYPKLTDSNEEDSPGSGTPHTWNERRARAHWKFVDDAHRTVGSRKATTPRRLGLIVLADDKTFNTDGSSKGAALSLQAHEQLKSLQEYFQSQGLPVYHQSRLRNAVSLLANVEQRRLPHSALSGLEGEEMLQSLRDDQVNTVVLAGGRVCAGHLAATAHAAFELDFDVAIADDAVGKLGCVVEGLGRTAIDLGEESVFPLMHSVAAPMDVYRLTHPLSSKIAAQWNRYQHAAGALVMIAAALVFTYFQLSSGDGDDKEDATLGETSEPPSNARKSTNVFH